MVPSYAYSDGEASGDEGVSRDERRGLIVSSSAVPAGDSGSSTGERRAPTVSRTGPKGLGQIVSWLSQNGRPERRKGFALRSAGVNRGSSSGGTGGSWSGGNSGTVLKTRIKPKVVRVPVEVARTSLKDRSPPLSGAPPAAGTRAAAAASGRQQPQQKRPLSGNRHAAPTTPPRKAPARGRGSSSGGGGGGLGGSRAIRGARGSVAVAAAAAAAAVSRGRSTSPERERPPPAKVRRLAKSAVQKPAQKPRFTVSRAASSSRAASVRATARAAVNALTLGTEAARALRSASPCSPEPAPARREGATKRTSAPAADSSFAAGHAQRRGQKGPAPVTPVQRERDGEEDDRSCSPSSASSSPVEVVGSAAKRQRTEAPAPPAAAPAASAASGAKAAALAAAASASARESMLVDDDNDTHTFQEAVLGRLRSLCGEHEDAQVLAEYISVMVAGSKDREEMTTELKAFFPDEVMAETFVNWVEDTKWRYLTRRPSRLSSGSAPAESPSGASSQPSGGGGAASGGSGSGGSATTAGASATRGGGGGGGSAPAAAMSVGKAFGATASAAAPPAVRAPAPAIVNSPVKRVGTAPAPAVAASPPPALARKAAPASPATVGFGYRATCGGPAARLGPAVVASGSAAASVSHVFEDDRPVRPQLQFQAVASSAAAASGCGGSGAAAPTPVRARLTPNAATFRDAVDMATPQMSNVAPVRPGPHVAVTSRVVLQPNPQFDAGARSSTPSAAAAVAAAVSKAAAASRSFAPTPQVQRAAPATAASSSFSFSHAQAGTSISRRQNKNELLEKMTRELQAILKKLSDKSLNDDMREKYQALAQTVQNQLAKISKPQATHGRLPPGRR